MRIKLLFVAALIFLSAVIQVNAAVAADIDLGIRQEDIIFLPPPSQLITGQEARIYATVHNFGDKDAKGLVSFFNGPYLLGESQPISVRARGFAEEVFIDFTVPQGSFNILAKLQSVNLFSLPNAQYVPPADANPANDEAVTTLITPLLDRDSDGVADSQDNCPSLVNGNQADNDGDKIGDVCDPDNDNDGVADIDELPRGTNPLKPDTDGDGMSDANDKRPLIADVSPLAIQKTENKKQKTELTQEKTNNNVAAGLQPMRAISDLISDTDELSGNVALQTPDAPEGVIILPAEQENKIFKGSLSKLWVVTFFSAVFAGIFSFLALRMKTPRE